MTMWTSADAINAEVEYRREHVRLTSRVVRRRRSARKERTRADERLRQRHRDEAVTGQDDRRRTIAVPEQRTSESGPKQPAQQA